MMENSAPVDDVSRMLSQGASNEQVIATLQERGYSNEAIRNALTLANTKAAIENPEQEPTRERVMLDAPVPGMQPSLLSQEGQPSSFMIPQPPQRMMSPQQEFGSGTLLSPTTATRELEEKMEEVAETIIGEKWHRVIEEVGDLGAWKERVSTDMKAMKQEILRVQGRFEALQNTVIGRVRDYDKSMEEVGADIKAIERVLKEILDPLTTNVKELKALTKELKR